MELILKPCWFERLCSPTVIWYICQEIYYTKIRVGRSIQLYRRSVPEPTPPWCGGNRTWSLPTVQCLCWGCGFKSCAALFCTQGHYVTTGWIEFQNYRVLLKGMWNTTNEDLGGGSSIRRELAWQVQGCWFKPRLSKGWIGPGMCTHPGMHLCTAGMASSVHPLPTRKKGTPPRLHRSHHLGAAGWWGPLSRAESAHSKCVGVKNECVKKCFTENMTRNQERTLAGILVQGLVKDKTPLTPGLELFYCDLVLLRPLRISKINTFNLIC